MKAKFLIIITAITVSLFGYVQHADALCMENQDWPDAPCYGCTGCYPGLEREKLDWAPYYDYKDSTWMDAKKQQLETAIKNNSLREWFEQSDNDAHKNIHHYYFLQGNVPNIYGMNFDEALEFEKMWNAVENNSSDAPMLLWNYHDVILDGTLIETDLAVTITGEHVPLHHIKANKYFKGEKRSDMITAVENPDDFEIDLFENGLFYLKKLESQNMYTVTIASVKTFGNCDARDLIEISPVLPNEKSPISIPASVKGYDDPCVPDYYGVNPDEKFVQDGYLIPEPEQEDKSVYENCGPGTTFQDGICIVNKTEQSTENSKWHNPYQNIISPLKQFKSEVPVDKIQCKQNLVLIQKHDGSPACVKSETKEKLEQRGWTITVHTSEDFAKQSTSHGDQKNISKMHVLYSVKKPLDSFETDSFHFMHYEDWDYDFLWKAARYGTTYLTDDEKNHYENILKPNGTNFKMTNHKGPSYYEMKLVEEHLPVESDLIKFTEYPSDIIEKYGDDMLSHNLGSTGFDKESEDLWMDAMQKPYEWTEVTERGGAFGYNRIGSGFPYFQMSDGTWVQLYYLGPRMGNYGLFELYAQGYGSGYPLEEFPEQTDDYPPGSKVLVRDREGSVSLTISVSDWEEYERFRTGDNSKDYPPPVKVTDENMHFVYFDMLLQLNTPKGFAETPGMPDEYRKDIDKDYPIHSHREIYDWLRLESGKQYGYSAGGDISPFFEYRDRLYRISSVIID